MEDWNVLWYGGTILAAACHSCSHLYPTYSYQLTKRGMVRPLSRQLACILSLCLATSFYHSNQVTEWIRVLWAIHRLRDDYMTRALLPDLVTVRNTSTKSIRDDNISPLCTRNQIKFGYWRPVEMARPPYVSRNKHLRCYPDEVYEQTPWKTWAWQPSDMSCSLSKWSAPDFCRVMNKTTLSIIGDSLSWEQYSSLLQLLGQKVRQTDQHKSKSEKKNHAQYACDKNTRIVFRNDPRLIWVADSIQDDFPMVLVLNRGAHYVNDTELLRGMNQTIGVLRQWQDSCRRLGFQCFLYWRTTVPGHPRCAALNETKPVHSVAAMEQRILNPENYDNITINYHWADFGRQNDLILQQLEDSGLTFNVIDGYHINILRPDEHRTQTGDCLHNCYPGKMDVYNQILLHYLRMERSEQEVEHLLERYHQALARRVDHEQ